MRKVSTPLIDALKEHQKENKGSFHVPGHKNGLYFHSELYDDFKNVLPYDLTELDHLDDLHAPKGAIKEAQLEAARFYGAKETLFLVGGTTAGNLAMVYALFERGETIFIQRNSHKSVFHAAQIAGVTPVLLAPERDEETDLPVGLTCETLKEALLLYPEAKGIVLTYPNYYGVSIEIKPLIKMAKDHGLTVLVDEAHAPHYRLGEPFPQSTLELGADVVIQSAHKMLPALTMSSYIHLSSSLHLGQIKLVKEALAMFQSSSPSYLLMASLDGARAYIEMITREQLTTIFASIKKIKDGLKKIDQISIIEWNELRQDYHFDPLKVTIKTNTSLTGYELQQLFYQVGLYPEMADEKHVLLVFGLGEIPYPEKEIALLKELLASYKAINKKQLPSLKFKETNVSKLYFTYNEVKSLQKKSVPILEAEGYIAAETIIPYPPGSPLLLVGEKLNEEAIMKIRQLQLAGAKFQGYEGDFEHVLVVIVEE